jgi:hypothetical protein
MIDNGQQGLVADPSADQLPNSTDHDLLDVLATWFRFKHREHTCGFMAIISILFKCVLSLAYGIIILCYWDRLLKDDYDRTSQTHTAANAGATGWTLISAGVAWLFFFHFPAVQSSLQGPMDSYDCSVLSCHCHSASFEWCYHGLDSRLTRFRRQVLGGSESFDCVLTPILH